MDSELTNHTKKQALRHYGIVMAFAVLVIVLVVFGVLRHMPQVPPATTKQTSTNVTSTSTVSAGLARSLPTTLRIPAINVDTTFEAPLKLNDDQTIEAPTSYEQVGWYVQGATPGEVGPAVILGHVDTYKGPAVFYSLGQLKKGDKIEVGRDDGTTAIFEVEELVRYNQSEFPTERVYGKTDVPVLRLITCTGIFNKGIQRYSHNLVVYATFVGEGIKTN